MLLNLRFGDGVRQSVVLPPFGSVQSASSQSTWRTARLRHTSGPSVPPA